MTWNPDGACRALVSFDASSGTPSIGFAFNCTLTDDAVGQFTMNFAAALVGDYVFNGCSRHDASPAGSTNVVSLRRNNVDAESTTTCKMVAIYEGTPGHEDSPEIALWITGSDA